MKKFGIIFIFVLVWTAGVFSFFEEFFREKDDWLVIVDVLWPIGLIVGVVWIFSRREQDETE